MAASDSGWVAPSSAPRRHRQRRLMPRRSPRTALAAAALALLVAVSGRAEATPGAAERKPRTPEGETAATPPRVHWHAEWPRVRPWQYAGAGALLAVVIMCQILCGSK
jgi:hypothetical protein